MITWCLYDQQLSTRASGVAAQRQMWTEPASLTAVDSCTYLMECLASRDPATRHECFITPSPIHRGTGYWFQSISLFVCMYVCIFVSLLARLQENGWTDLHEIFREGVSMWSDHGRRDSILGQFGETAWCRDAQHGDGVCSALAPQLVN